MLWIGTVKAFYSDGRRNVLTQKGWGNVLTQKGWGNVSARMDRERYLLGGVEKCFYCNFSLITHAGKAALVFIRLVVAPVL